MGISAQDLFGIANCDVISMEQEEKDGKVYWAIHLEYNGKFPMACPECGCVPLYKHGTRTVRIIDTPFRGLPSVLYIKHPRGRCSTCHSVWTPAIDGIDTERQMTNRAFIAIAQLSLRTTFADVTNDYAISEKTVQRVFCDFVDAHEALLQFKTPAFLGIDEINLDRLGEVTVITDLEHHTLFDILPKRNQPELTKYFSQLRDREQVLWVCSDMYRPFQKSIASSLPNAKWAVDHFHVVAKANEAVDEVRRRIQDDMEPKERIKTKRGLAYTLKKRLKDLDTEEGEKIKLIRNSPKHAPMATAFDLKEDFYNIYDNNPTSKENAIKAFNDWEASIPADPLYQKFRDLAKTVHNFHEQVFAYWDCPIAISNGFTECTNRLIRENNLKGRGYSFKVLRGRTMFRKANLTRAIEHGLIYGPKIEEVEPNFHMEATSEDD